MVEPFREPCAQHLNLRRIPLLEEKTEEEKQRKVDELVLMKFDEGTGLQWIRIVDSTVYLYLEEC